MDTEDIAKIGIPAAVVGVSAYFVGRQELNNLLKKSIVVRVADNAPSAVKLMLSSLHISVKLQEVYNSINKPEQSPISEYFKITLE